MAGDWIKLEHVTPDKPEVISIANILGIDIDAVTGKLIRLWIWADQQTLDGNAGGNGVSVTKAFIDRCTFVAGFADAMEQCGWLVIGEGGQVTFPNFDRHNGKTAKHRALTSKRVSRHRGRCNAERNAVCNAERNAPSVTEALPEKRREENINTPIVPKGTEYSQSFGLWWEQYPKSHRTGKQAAYRAYQKSGKSLLARGMTRDQAVEFLRMKIIEFSASPKGHSDYVPNPATWLNQGRYDDDPSAWQRGDSSEPDTEETPTRIVSGDISRSSVKYFHQRKPANANSSTTNTARPGVSGSPAAGGSGTPSTPVATGRRDMGLLPESDGDV